MDKDFILTQLLNYFDCPNRSLLIQLIKDLAEELDRKDECLVRDEIASYQKLEETNDENNTTFR